MLRKAKLSDVPAINHLRLQVRENTLSDPSLVTEKMTGDAITRDGRGWVFKEEGTILGFSIALDADPSIWALFVHPDQEAHGIGHALLEAAVNWLWSRGATTIWLSTEPGTRAEKFYRDRGWQQTGHLKNGDMRMELKRPLRTADSELG